MFASLLLLSAILLPAAVLAQERGDLRANQSTTTTQSTSTSCSGGYTLGVPLGGLTSVPRDSSAFRCYVLGLYRYVIGLAVILAAIVCTYAGYVYLTSSGDPTMIQHSRELIIGALSGLALLLLASTVLRFIGIGQ